MSCKFFFHFQLFIFYFLQNVQSLFHLPLSFKPNTSPWPPVVTAGTAGNTDIFVYILYIYICMYFQHDVGKFHALLSLLFQAGSQLKPT